MHPHAGLTATFLDISGHKGYTAKRGRSTYSINSNIMEWMCAGAKPIQYLQTVLVLTNSEFAQC